MRAIVVGAGIFGSSAAYSLARDGAEVLVVDQVHPGKATLAGAGILCPWGTRTPDSAFTRFYVAGADYYRRLVPELAAAGLADVGYRVVGGMVLAKDDAEMAEIESRVLPRVKDSATAGEVRRLTPPEAQALFPPLRDDLMALHISGAARIEARDVATSLLTAAQARGAELRRGHVELKLAGGRAVATLDGSELGADAILVTAGAWANEILRELGVEIPVEPQRGQIIHIRLEGVDTSRWPVLLPQGPHYMVAFDDGRVVAGATRETGSGFDYRLTAGGQAEVLNFALDLAPGLFHATHIETRIGFRPFTPQIRPMIGGVGAVPNLFIGNGLGAGGLTMGPLAGELLAQVARGQTPELDLAEFGVPV